MIWVCEKQVQITSALHVDITRVQMTGLNNEKAKSSIQILFIVLFYLKPIKANLSDSMVPSTRHNLNTFKNFRACLFFALSSHISISFFLCCWPISLENPILISNFEYHQYGSKLMTCAHSLWIVYSGITMMRGIYFCRFYFSELEMLSFCCFCKRRE